jgi:hypothetical protein
VSAGTLGRCDGGCGRIIDPLNDMPPVDDVSVHSTALIIGDDTGPWHFYCHACAETLFGPAVEYPMRGLGERGPWTN